MAGRGRGRHAERHVRQRRARSDRSLGAPLRGGRHLARHGASRLQDLLTLLPAAFALCAVPSLGADGTPPAAAGTPISLSVRPAGEVSKLDLRLIEEALVLRLLDDDCGYRLARDADRPALTFDVAISRFWESESPGGARRFDPATGLDVTGVVVNVELGFDLAIRPAGGGEPLARKSRLVRRSGSTQRNPKWDPRRQTRSDAYDALARDLRKIGCRAVRKQQASEKRKARDSR